MLLNGVPTHCYAEMWEAKDADKRDTFTRHDPYTVQESERRGTTDFFTWMLAQEVEPNKAQGWCEAMKKENIILPFYLIIRN